MEADHRSDLNSTLGDSAELYDVSYTVTRDSSIAVIDEDLRVFPSRSVTA